MKRIWLAAPVLVLLASGCLQIKQKLTLKEDGSGEFKVEYTVPDETSQRMHAMLTLADQLAAAEGGGAAPPAEDDLTRLLFDPQEPAIRQKVESYAVYGIHIEELEVLVRNTRKDVKLRVSFTNISQVAKADFFAGYGFSLLKSATGAYVIQTRPPTTGKADASWVGNQESANLTAPLLGGFRFDFEVQTPGLILKSNADHSTPYTAQWTFDFDSNNEAMSDLQRKSMMVAFEGKDLQLPLFKQPSPKPAAAAAPVQLVAPTAPMATPAGRQ